MPLGGAGEIGMNAYVYGYGKPGKERLILVDLGVAFPDMDSTPGVDLIMPDMTWLAENQDRLEAVFITHAHEDHIGGIAHMWTSLGSPTVFARTFTAHHARRKMEERGANVVAVPKSTIIRSPPKSSCPATVFTNRSGPTAVPSSTRTSTGSLHSGFPTTSGRVLK